MRLIEKSAKHLDKWDEENWDSWPWYGKWFLWLLIGLLWVVTSLRDLFDIYAEYRAEIQQRKNANNGPLAGKSEEA